MAHFAQVSNGIVQNVIVLGNDVCGEPDVQYPETEPRGQAFIASLGLTGTWLQTSYNSNFRGQYAGIGYLYDATLDIFKPPTTEDDNG
jgi:hypothetical protein